MGPLNVLVSSAGRRVALVECFRESLLARNNAGSVFAIDAGTTAPASFLGLQSFRVPPCTDPAFVPAVLRICEQNRVALVVPTIDTELPIYAAAREQFERIGTTISVSSADTIQISCNKIATHQWLASNGFPTVRQTGAAAALNDPVTWPLPLIAKPYNGSASAGVRKLSTRRELEAAAEIAGLVVQELAKGKEFTINVYVNRQGECICAVPHWRMEVRAGEVSKGVTVKDARLIGIARTIAEELPGAYGPLNIQCFMDEAGDLRIIEINARFGGGYPLAHRAGAKFTTCLLDELEGKSLSYFEDWTDDLAMLRYDDAVFIPGSRMRT